MAVDVDLEELSAATSPAQWRAFYAHVVDGIPVKDIAEAEGVSVPAIYSRIRQARHDLHAALLRSRAAKRAM